MALTYSHKMNAVRNPTMADSQPISDIDFDMLVTHVESAITEDKQRQQTGLTPQELMLRSNPALFTWENLAASDLTNPREMYTILSNKSKSIEDLAEKFKKELVKSIQSPASFPKLSRAVSMSDIEHKHSRGYKPSEHAHRQLKMLALKRHNTSVTDGFRKVKEADIENVRALNLPHIEKQLSTQGDPQKFKERAKPSQAELPTLVQTVANSQKPKTGDPKQDDSNEKHVSFSDTKLEKWFSEMPNEEFDKAQRALMEESIQERLQEFKRSRNRKMNFPNQGFHICIGPRHQRVPNTYLELRVDSFGKHLQSEKEEKRNRYRLQQKSMHHLKMREKADGDPHDKIHREDTFPKLLLTPKVPTPGKQKGKPEPENTAAKYKKDTTKVQLEGGIKTVYINDRFGTDIGQNLSQKHGISNYEDYTEKLFATKEMQYQELLRRLADSPTSNVDYSIEDAHEDTLERENTKAKVVNLELNRKSPYPRKPLHLEKSLNEAYKAKYETTNSKENTQTASDLGAENKENSSEHHRKQDKIITKIPTAPSIRTSESRSSNSSVMSKSNKEAMKKFNKLEVFAESHPAADINPGLRSIPENKFRQYRELHGTSVPSSQKMDTKQQRQEQAQPGDPSLSREIRRPEADVVFRFEPGEVFVSRKNPNHTLTNSLSNERARVIYGKAAQGEKKSISDKHVGKKESITDNFSTATKSTKLENFYRSELGRFESRALDETLSTISPRQDFETDPTLKITSNNQDEHGFLIAQRINPVTGVVPKRDVATETDLIGSAQFHQLPQSERSGSGLSDFIIDNNDGESLESDSEESSLTPNFRQKSTQSV